MGREIRRVPENWEHPKSDNGDYIPLHDGKYSEELEKWKLENEKWNEGLSDDWNGGWKPKKKEYENMSYSEYNGSKPKKKDYMPEFDESELTHIMMYEDTSEGTPISPAFETPEELAHWLADNNASAFGDMTATYEHWLATCKSGWAPSAVVVRGKMMSGVEGINE
jgi:hypothetical protein